MQRALLTPLVESRHAITVLSALKGSLLATREERGLKSAPKTTLAGPDYYASKVDWVYAMAAYGANINGPVLTKLRPGLCGARS